MTDFDNSASNSWEILGRLTRLPPDVSRLAPSPFASGQTCDVDVMWNPSSTMVAISGHLPQEYYDDYLMTTTYSRQMQELQEKQSQRLALLAQETGTSDSATTTALEVGCGDGSFLSHLDSHFDAVVGVEPSSRFAAEARARGHYILEGFICDVANDHAGQFDAFAARQVFEHVPDPLAVLASIRRMLKPGAVGLIEVPNGYRALRLGRAFEFFPDHVSYFSVEALVSLGAEAGFRVLSCEESFGGDYLELWLALDPHPALLFDRLLSGRERTRDALAKWRVLAPPGKGAFFGCGAKALTIAALDRDLFNSIFELGIDSDPHKQGLFVPGTSVQVVDVSDERLNDATSVLILALSYRQEIAETIYARLPAVELVGTLDDLGDLVILDRPLSMGR